MDPNFEPLRSIGAMAMMWPKSQNSSLGHDGALSIRNFVRNEDQLIFLFYYIILLDN
jgi:hypothetical protein